MTRRIASVLLEDKKVLVRISNISIEVTYLKLIFTKFACCVKKVLVRHTGAYRHKKHCA